MWKIVVGFLLFAGLALFILSKGGDIDMSGEKHGSEATSADHAPAAPAAPDVASVASAAPLAPAAVAAPAVSAAPAALAARLSKEEAEVTAGTEQFTETLTLLRKSTGKDGKFFAAQLEMAVEVFLPRK